MLLRLVTYSLRLFDGIEPEYTMGHRAMNSDSGEESWGTLLYRGPWGVLIVPLSHMMIPHGVTVGRRVLGNTVFSWQSGVLNIPSVTVL